MKTTELVKTGLYLLFNEYQLGRFTNEYFVKRLKTLCSSRGKKSYWWRFFKDDTGANDWLSVQDSLRSPKNTAYLKECIDIALKQKSIEVNYS